MSGNIGPSQNALKFYYKQVLKREKVFWEIPRSKKQLQLPRFLNQDEVAAIIDSTSVDNFCNVQRSGNLAVDSKEGTIVYSNKYSRYAVSLTDTSQGNIDSQVIGFVCNLPSEFQKIGIRVIVSGTLKNFNSDENISPEIAGQDLHFFEISQIIKKL